MASILQLLTTGTRVWVKDNFKETDPERAKIFPWRSAEIVELFPKEKEVQIQFNHEDFSVQKKDEEENNQNFLEIEFGTKKTEPMSKEIIRVPLTNVELRNPRNAETYEDLTGLNYLNEPAVMFNLLTRYKHDNIYTYTGSILIAINPYKPIPIYSKEMAFTYKDQNYLELTPHVFATAENSLTNLLKNEKNQSLLISGESGAGKTETTKIILNYFAMMTNSKKNFQKSKSKELQKNSIETKIIECNPLLEAFGNAKTERNNNSSRFGKFINVHFENEKIHSGQIDSYLLEKSRVVSVPKGERSYHIFYQFLVGISIEEQKKYFLKTTNPSNFFYLSSHNDNFDISGVSDHQQFEISVNSMKTLNFSDFEISTVLMFVAVVLHLGNVTYQDGKNDEAHPTLEGEQILKNISEMLEIDLKIFSNFLTSKKVVTPSETFMSPLKSSQAKNLTDSLAMTLYTRLFSWIVSKINDSLKALKKGNILSIGLLDIYGFEFFKTNSFEQFCINYANEKLQQQFNHYVFRLEQSIYQAEKIDWSVIEFNDNQRCLDLIEKPHSFCIIYLLDEYTKINNSDENLLEQLNKVHKDNEYFIQSKYPGEFTIKHYAGSVTYQIENFIDKNRDFVIPEIFDLFKKSNLKILNELFSDHTISNPSSSSLMNEFSKLVSPLKKQNLKNIFSSVSSQFKNSLQNLILTLSGTQPHYIRCIRPNSFSVSDFIDFKMTLEQLKNLGIFEAIRLKKEGFPNSPDFRKFLLRYRDLVSERKLKNLKTIEEKVKFILEQSKVDPKQYQVGLTRVFFRQGQIELLEKFRTKKFADCAINIQREIRRFLCQKKYIKTKESALNLQSIIWSYQEQKIFHKIRKENAIICLQTPIIGYFSRKIFHQKMEAVLSLQSAILGAIARENFQQMAKYKSVITLQNCFRCFNAKKIFSEKKNSVLVLQSLVLLYNSKVLLEEKRGIARKEFLFKETQQKLEEQMNLMKSKLEENTKLEYTLKELAEELLQWKSKAIQLKEDITKIQKDKENDMRNFKTKSLEFETQRLQFERDNNSLQSKNQNLSKENIELQERINEFQKETEKTKEKEEILNNELKDMKLNYKKERESNQELNIQIENFKKENEELRKQKEQVAKQFNSLSSTHKTDEKEVLKLRSDLENEKKNSQNLTVKVSKLKKKINALVIDEKLAKKIKEEETDLVLTVAFGLYKEEEWKFTFGLPSPSYLIYLYTRYCITAEKDAIHFLDFSIKSISQIALGNPELKFLIFWVSTTTLILHLMLKDSDFGIENKFPKKITFPKEDEEYTSEMNAFLKENQEFSQVVFDLVHLIQKIYVSLIQLIVSKLEGLTSKLFSGQEGMSFVAFLNRNDSKTKVPSPLAQFSSTLHQIKEQFTENHVFPPLTQHTFKQVFKFLEARVLNNLFVRKDSCSPEKAIQFKFTTSLLDDLISKESTLILKDLNSKEKVSLTGNFKHFPSLEDATNVILFKPKSDLEPNQFPNLNPTQIKSILSKYKSDSEFEDVQIPEKVLKNLDPLSKDEQLLVSTTIFESLDVNLFSDVNPDNLLSRAPSRTKLEFSFLSKEIFGLIQRDKLH